MNAARPRRLLTVCLGNHCRSPLAALILETKGLGAVEVRSAGTRDKWVGQPAHESMVTAAAARGYDLTAHRGVQVSRDLLAWADAVLAMDRNILVALWDMADESMLPKLAPYLGNRDVPDPWGKDCAAFAEVVDLIEAGAARHLP
ncbi:low molecular weight phosphotyrosine protein phosphatase [Streptomyces sp. NPDC050844]|uniref:arsenate reductase/protein-tyrosine-phosphatase family protein n=1 Tax=Streptomyces sp. NPDC050844 TaxID=3155790 RepID=UPI0033C43DA2